MSDHSDPPSRHEGRAFGVPARRQAIIALLSEAYARNDLEQDELERRLELAERARTIEELEALIADFPAEARQGYSPAGAAVAPPVSHVGAVGKDLEQQVEALDGLSAPTRFSLLGDMNIDVRPSEPRVLRAVTVIGDTSVDLRQLSGALGAYLLKVAVLIGDTRIMVPRDTRVEIRMLTLVGDNKRTRKKDGLLGRLAKKFGAVPAETEESPAPPGPTVVVTGFKLIGDTVIVED